MARLWFFWRRASRCTANLLMSTKRKSRVISLMWHYIHFVIQTLKGTSLYTCTLQILGDTASLQGTADQYKLVHTGRNEPNCQLTTTSCTDRRNSSPCGERCAAIVWKQTNLNPQLRVALQSSYQGNQALAQTDGNSSQNSCVRERFLPHDVSSIYPWDSLPPSPVWCLAYPSILCSHIRVHRAPLNASITLSSSCQQRCGPKLYLFSPVFLPYQ